MLIAGIDFGSSLIKAVASGHEFVTTAMVGEFNEGWSGMGSDSSWDNNLCVYIGVDQEGNAYKQFFGELARTQSEVKRVLTKGGHIANAADVELSVKTALAMLALKNGLIHDDTQEVQEIDCIATVGVPVATNVNTMKELSQNLKGIRELIVENDNSKKIMNLRINITSCMVVYGPYGSYVQMLQEFEESTAVDAVITDIGYGSAEILTIYEGRPNMPSSASIIDLSLEALANQIALTLQKQTGKIVRGVDLMRLLQEDKKTVILAGETLDISEVKKYFIESIASSLTDAIIDLVSQLPPDARIKYYIFTGDGVTLFWQDLEMLLFQKNLIRDINQAAHPKDYKVANALGFEYIAKSRYAKMNQ
ncbi:MAG: hypothetical protein ACFFCS_03160 [Candidatus Hodarchaeota archaeon]